MPVTAANRIADPPSRAAAPLVSTILLEYIIATAQIAIIAAQTNRAPTGVIAAQIPGSLLYHLSTQALIGWMNARASAALISPSVTTFLLYTKDVIAQTTSAVSVTSWMLITSPAVNDRLLRRARKINCVIVNVRLGIERNHTLLWSPRWPLWEMV